MTVESNGITIHLEKNEIENLWNIVMFAFDWQEYAEKNGKPTMRESELKLAKEIVDITDKIK